MKSTRCKMRLESVVGNEWGGVKAFFRCAYGNNPEDNQFAKATPVGQAEFVIDNPAASQGLVIGREYYFDITEVPKVVAEPEKAPEAATEGSAP